VNSAKSHGYFKTNLNANSFMSLTKGQNVSKKEISYYHYINLFDIEKNHRRNPRVIFSKNQAI
jgi:hypothetical protein